MRSAFTVRTGAFAALVAGTLWCAYGLITRELVPRYWDVQRGVDYIAVALNRVGLLLADRRVGNPFPTGGTVWRP